MHLVDKSGVLKTRQFAVVLLFLLAGLLLATIFFSPKSSKEKPLKFVGLTNDLVCGRVGVFRCRVPWTSRVISFVEWADQIERISISNEGIRQTNILTLVPPNRITIVTIPSSLLRPEMELLTPVPLNVKFGLHCHREIRYGIWYGKSYKPCLRSSWTKTEYFGCEVMLKPD